MEAAAFNNRRNLKPNNCLTNDIWNIIYY
jgi:hypothetical protein